MKTSRCHRYKVFGVFLLCIISGIGCKKQSADNDRDSQSDLDPNSYLAKIDTGTFLTMGTFGRIQIHCTDKPSGRQAIEQAWVALERVDQRFSTYRDDSELSRVNHLAAKQPVAISQETYRLLQKARDYSQRTGGAFDITVAPLIRLWKQAEKQNRLPSEAEIKEAQTKVGFDKIILTASAPPTVSFIVEGMELNVDAIAKGYGVDQVLAALRRRGVIAALVDIGGEVAAFGQNRPGLDWIVGIQNPNTANRDHPSVALPPRQIRLQDCAVATSGNYRQYVQIDGTQYSHIIDPRTGWPADLLPSVTVIAPTTADADALATAISVMGIKKGLALIESLDHTEAFFISDAAEGSSIVHSSGFGQYQVEKVIP